MYIPLLYLTSTLFFDFSVFFISIFYYYFLLYSLSVYPSRVKLKGEQHGFYSELTLLNKFGAIHRSYMVVYGEVYYKE